MIQQFFGKIYKIELPIPFPMKTTNVYFIDDSPKTLVDTGIKTDASFEMLRKSLKEVGGSLESIERILITHGHIDHYGQAQRIASLSGATIYIHPKEYGRIRSLIHTFGPLKSILIRNGVPEELVHQAIGFIGSAQKMADPLNEAFFLEEGEFISFSSMRWKAVHCPGHSPGLLCFYWPERKTLFTGDHLLKEITPNPVLNVPDSRSPLRYTSLQEYLSSLKRLETFDLGLLLPGHGEEVDDPMGLIRKIIEHHRERMNHVLASLARGEKTPYEIAMDLFPGVPPFEVFLGISEAVGHLEILRQEGRVFLKEREGKDYYTLHGDD